MLSPANVHYFALKTSFFHFPFSIPPFPFSLLFFPFTFPLSFSPFPLGIGSKGAEAFSSHHIWMFIPYIHLSICFSVHLSICLSVHLSICPSVRLSICPSVHLSICLSILLSVCLSVRLFVCPYVCPYVHTIIAPLQGHASSQFYTPLRASAPPYFLFPPPPFPPPPPPLQRYDRFTKQLNNLPKHFLSRPKYRWGIQGTDRCTMQCNRLNNDKKFLNLAEEP
jgi:hypothetical protein